MFHEIGRLVEARGQRWQLTRTAVYGDCAILTLDGRDAGNRSERMRVIEPFERIHTLAAPHARRVTRQTAMRAAASAIALARPATGLWTAAAARIELWPYQLEPALSVLAGSTRLLLADAVGLGKTIQAGLILSELRERGWIDRALIVCPAGVREGWARELRERFRIDAAVFDQLAIADRIAALPPGVNPWLAEPIVIASIDFVKRREVQAALAGTPIDLLIVDEAHHLVPGTDRGAAISELATRSPWCVLASATPHSGDVAAFNYLSGVGAAGDPITIFRRTRAEAGFESRRRGRLLRTSPTPAERALLTAIHDYSRAIWTARGQRDRAVKLIAITIERRAASSRQAIERTLTRRLELLSGGPATAVQPALPWLDEDDEDDVESDATLAAVGLDDVNAECRAIETLLALAHACDSSAKLHRIGALLSRTREPAIIFTEYRDSLDAMVAAFAKSYRTGAIHGGLPPQLRRSIVDAFNDGQLDLLVATDTAGEGLNLHYRCRLVVNLELPWNPMRLEQRIGRVDRLGQRRTVHAIHLCHRDSIEERVFENLERKLHVAEAIFDGVSDSFARDLAVGSHTIAAATAEAARVRRIRNALPAASDPVWARPRQSSRCYVIVERITHVNDYGLVIGEQIRACRVEFARMPQTDREWRVALQQVSERAVLPEAIENGAAELLVARIESMASRLASKETVLYQRSLFDSRSDQAADARKAHLNALTTAFSQTLQRTSSASTTTPRIELVAAWPERPA